MVNVEKAKEKLYNVKALVQEFLEDVPETRNSDRMLTAMIRRKLLWTEALTIHDVMRLPTQESIKRMRARFQQQGLYMPTDPNVADKRNAHQGVVKSVLRGE